MQITFHKISDHIHEVSVQRDNGTTEQKRLASRSFLLHDFAHLAVEQALQLNCAFWGSVAQGASLSADSYGEQTDLVERMVGPIQVLLRDDASPRAYAAVLEQHLSNAEVQPLADQIHQRARALKGQWRATPRGQHMSVVWAA